MHEQYIEQDTPPQSDTESADILPPQNNTGKKRANKFRKWRSRESAKKDHVINKLKRKVEKYKKRYRHIKKKIGKSKADITSRKRVDLVMKNKEGRNEIRKKLLFTKAIKEKLNQSYNNLSS